MKAWADLHVAAAGLENVENLLDLADLSDELTEEDRMEIRSIFEAVSELTTQTIQIVTRLQNAQDQKEVDKTDDNLGVGVECTVPDLNDFRLHMGRADLEDD